MTYPVYVAKRDSFKLNRGIISGYLEGKAEGDLIERRAVKLAVAMEMLKDRFLRQSNTVINEFILEPKIFDRMKKKIRNALRPVLDQCISEEQQLEILEKLGDLNRTSFKRILKATFAQIGFKCSDDELHLFIKCRNELVHKGIFYVPKVEEHSLFFYAPLQNEIIDRSYAQIAAQEYYFMEYFVDSVMLKLLGYSGSFNDVRMHSSRFRQSGNPGTIH